MTHDRHMAGNEIVLAIECAVGFGSVALMANGEVIASTSGQDCRPSRAEEVLGIIDLLLTQTDLPARQINGIVVSAGPGSYSGIRIGLATALGLKHSLGITLAAVPLLDAMAVSSVGDTNFVAAVPVGKKDIAWQSFGKDALATGEPELAPETEFLDRLGVTLPGTLIVHSDLMSLVDRLPNGIQLCDSGNALAEHLGTYASRNPGKTRSRPLYLRNRSHNRSFPT